MRLGVWSALLLLLGAALATAHSNRKLEGGVVKPAIMGGNNTVPGQWPVVARFVATSGLGFCGGTLVAPQIVMASAACFVDASGQFIAGRKNPLVHIGIWDRYISSGPYMEDRRAIRTWVHAGYNATTFQNDIALLLLDSPVARAPAVLPPPTRKPAMAYPAGTPVTAVGWGDDGSGNFPAILQDVGLTLQSLAACEAAWAGELPSFATNSMICAGSPPTYLKSSCNGDGGNGLFVMRPAGPPVVIGITSYGVSCQKVKQGEIPGKPDAYTDVAAMMPWIQESMRCMLLGSSSGQNGCRAQVYGDPKVVGFDGSRFSLGGAPGDRVTLLTGTYSACINATTGVPTNCTVPTVTNFEMRSRLVAGPGRSGGWAAAATGGAPLPGTALGSMSLKFGDALWVFVDRGQLHAYVQGVPVRAGGWAPTWGGAVWFRNAQRGQPRRVDISKHGIEIRVEQPWIPSHRGGQYASWVDVYVTLTNIPVQLGGVLGATYPAVLPASAPSRGGGIRMQASLKGMP